MKNLVFATSIAFAVVTTATQAAALSGQSHAGHGVRIPADLCVWNNVAWSYFNSAERAAWSGLGWTKQIWDGSDQTAYPASYRSTWSELPAKDKRFAAKLGFSSKTWGVGDCPNYSTLAQNGDSAPVLRDTISSLPDVESPVRATATSGYGELFGLLSSDSEAKGFASKQDYAGLGGGGHVNFWFGDSYTLQIDGAASFFRIESDEERVFAMEALVHAGWRNPEQGYLGAFGGLLSYGYGGSDCCGGGNYSYDQYVVGGEGALYWDMMTFFAQAGFMDSWSADGGSLGNSFTDTWFARGGLRYFATPNMKLEASGGILSGNEYANDGPCCRVDMPFWKVGGEYKPDDSRVSWFASYGGYSEDEVDYEHTNHTIVGGVRVHFGQESLMSFDRSGASLDFLDTRMLIQAYDH